MIIASSILVQVINFEHMSISFLHGDDVGVSNDAKTQGRMQLYSNSVKMVLFNRKTYTCNVMNLHKSTHLLRFIYVIELFHGSRIRKLSNFLLSKHIM